MCSTSPGSSARPPWPPKRPSVKVLAEPAFVEGRATTATLGAFQYRAVGIEVLEAGTQTTVQDYPGRTGYWDVGVPPSGPYDNLALRLGNRVLGNAPGAPALEMALTGAVLRFRTAAAICVAGADMGATLDGKPVPAWEAIAVPAGATQR